MKIIKDFQYRELGKKLDYGIFHPKVENGEKLLGWIRKFCVDYEKNRNNRNKKT